MFFFWLLSIKWFLKNCIAHFNDVAWFFYRNVFFKAKRIMIRYYMNFDFTKIWFVKTNWFRTNCSFLIETFVEMKFDHWCVKIEMFCWQNFLFYKCVKQIADVKFDCRNFEIAINDSSIMKNWYRSLLLLEKIDEVKKISWKKNSDEKKYAKYWFLKIVKQISSKKIFEKKNEKISFHFAHFKFFFSLSQRK